jgi:hypothetical protein
MGWLRIDDNYSSNAKIAALSDREYRVWHRVLEYCARNRDPLVDGRTVREVAGLQPRMLGRFREVGLLDENERGLVAHDWELYNAGTVEERVAGFLRSHPGASANDVQRSVPGRRADILAAIRSLKPGAVG